MNSALVFADFTGGCGVMRLGFDKCTLYNPQTAKMELIWAVGINSKANYCNILSSSDSCKI